jgi:trigger factor
VSHPVTDEDVEGELETLRERNSRLVVSDKPAADGDTLLIDYAGYIDGEAFEGGTAEKLSLKLGSGDFIPGFEEQLVGAAAGDEREVSIKFPEDYFAGRLAGKDALFKCKVIGVKSEEKPELDDEFAQEASEFDTMDELRSKTRERLESAASAKSEFEMKNSLLEQIYKANEIDIPDAMVETQIDELVDELNQRLRYQGMDVDGYLKYTKRDMKGLRDGMREDAFKKVKTRLIVRAIADAEGMQASEDEIDKEISDMAKQLKTDAGKLRESLAATHMKLVKEDIRNRKAIDFLYASAEIDYSQKTG